MTQTFHCSECNIDTDLLSFPNCANKSQARAAGYTILKSIPCPSCKGPMAEKKPISTVEKYYRCRKCERVIALVLPENSIPDTRFCICGDAMDLLYMAGDAPSVSRIGGNKATLDTIVGHNAAERWEKINERQETRNKIRRKAGQQGLVAISPTSYAPISEDQKKLRTRVMSAAQETGIGIPNSPSEQVLVG